MHIFGKKKETEAPELALIQIQEGRAYHFSAVLAKALLLFLLVYGALGGFLSAYEIAYNNGLCMLVLFALSLILSAVYETEKRYITNIGSLLIFLIYLYIAVSNYWAINSGYYAVLNRVYETARDYLLVDSGMEYSLVMEETYTTITMFTMFLGMVGIILLNIILQNKCSLLKVILLTLTPYVIPFYFDCSPEPIYMLFLLIGYLTITMLQGGDTREKLSGPMRYILPVAAVLTILAVRIFSFILPEGVYEAVMPKNAVKEASEEDMTWFAQYGMMSMFRPGSVGAGVSGGRLNKDAAVTPSYETMLKVRYTPYDLNAVYLKAFTGKDYLGDRWSQAGDDLLDDVDMFTSVDRRMRNYYGLTKDERYEKGLLQGRGIMEVEKLDDDDVFEYQPYYTDIGLTVSQGNVSSYVYYPEVSQINGIAGEVTDEYLNVPASCKDAVMEVCEEEGFAGTAEEIAEQIVNYFQDNYTYTLRPGYYYGNSDYISHFLLESKKGYCAHFASAATMLLRQMGIYSRYVEGYSFSYLNLIDNGKLIEDAEYSDYYDGYAPIGETGLIEIEIPDAYAHAWVEIYVEDEGWIVVDATPARTSREDTMSFWEAFMNRDSEGTDLELTQSNLGTYLENALGSVTYILMGAVILFLIGLCTIYLIRTYRERKLPARERVRLEYGRLQSRLSRKHQDYRKLRTLREQLDWIRDNSRLEIDMEKEEALYQVYFAENVEYDCAELYKYLHKMRNRLLSGHFGHFAIKSH